MKTHKLHALLCMIFLNLSCKKTDNIHGLKTENTVISVENTKNKELTNDLFVPHLYNKITLPVEWKNTGEDLPTHSFPEKGIDLQRKLQAGNYAGIFQISDKTWGLAYFALGGDYYIPCIAVIDSNGKILDDGTTSQGNCGNMFICDDTCIERFLIHNSRSFETKLSRTEHWCEEKSDWKNDSIQTIIIEESRTGTIAENGIITISETKTNVSVK